MQNYYCAFGIFSCIDLFEFVCLPVQDTNDWFNEPRRDITLFCISTKKYGCLKL